MFRVINLSGRSRSNCLLKQIFQFLTCSSSLRRDYFARIVTFSILTSFREAEHGTLCFVAQIVALTRQNHDNHNTKPEIISFTSAQLTECRLATAQ
jgi:hypothetical protein